eukprot:1157226-Pelagomonas_calceolata.AAC.13
MERKWMHEVRWEGSGQRKVHEVRWKGSGAALNTCGETGRKWASTQCVWGDGTAAIHGDQGKTCPLVTWRFGPTMQRGLETMDSGICLRGGLRSPQ